MKQLETRTIIAAALGVFAVYLGMRYWPFVEDFAMLVASAAAPLAWGLVLAYPLNILMGFYERHLFARSSHGVAARIRPGASLALALLTFALVVTAVIWLIVPQLVDCLRLLISELPVAVDALMDWLEKSGFITSDRVAEALASLEGLDWRLMAGTVVQAVMGGVVDAVASIVSGATTFLLALIFAIFVLLNKQRLARQANLVMERYLCARALARVRYVASVADDCFHRFLVGQCTEALVLGALCALGMLLLQLPYAMMIGALTAFTALIPVVGAFISGGVGVFLILMESPMQALVFLVFIIVLQQLEGDLIYPHVVGSSIQLPGIWVLAAVTVGGGVSGIAGMFVGVPLAACAYRLLRNDVYGAAPVGRA